MIKIIQFVFCLFMFAVALMFASFWHRQSSLNKRVERFNRIDRVHLKGIDNFEVMQNDRVLVDYFRLVNLPQPEISLMLAKIESGNYSSFICRENRNLFGIKYFPAARHNISDQNKFGYCYYDSYIESVIGLKRYYQLAGTHLVGYSGTPGYWSRNWARYVAYIRSPQCTIDIDTNGKIIY